MLSVVDSELAIGLLTFYHVADAESTSIFQRFFIRRRKNVEEALKNRRRKY